MPNSHYISATSSPSGSGGLLFVGAMGADKGVLFMAHDGGAKGYVQSLNAEADFIGGTNPLFI